MMRRARRLVCGFVTVVGVVGVGCSGGEGRAGEDSASPPTSARSRREEPLPRRVAIRPEPEGVTLADPSFEPLPDARADFGRLGGTVYQIEIPDKWSGRLVLEMHGFGEFASEVDVSPPDFRRHLIGRGIAWAASSFSSSSLIPGRAADETAALWDHFARKYGRPTWTYVTGWSMGGAATHVAAERYANRFDGALAFCGAAGQTAALSTTADFVAAGAYVAGVSQAEYDASTDLGALIRERIRPALREPKAREQFERIVIDLTGGPRRFDREGIRDEEETNWRRGTLLVESLAASNRDTEYRLPGGGSPTSDEYNRRVIRFRTNDAFRRTLLEGNELTGNLRMPLLSMHTTGDGQVPIEQARILHREVEAAGIERLLVHRVVEDPGHCGFTTEEMEVAFDALVEWVERGVKPAGTNVMVDDLRTLDRTFERQPRIGTPAGDAVMGATDRVTLHGRLTLDGSPFDARFLGAVVVRGGMSTPCQLEASPVTGGRYEITVAAEREVSGCGAPGAMIVLWTFVNDQKLFSVEPAVWPREDDTSFDATFSRSMPQGAAPPTADFAGEVYRPDGRRLPPGTRIEARIGGSVCGISSVRRTGSFSGFILAVAGPESIPACRQGAAITFRVNGHPAVETAVNEAGRGGPLTDLTVRSPRT
jgi:pimeloyl-ACP methyl ester carboxylesterase